MPHTSTGPLATQRPSRPAANVACIMNTLYAVPTRNPAICVAVGYRDTVFGSDYTCVNVYSSSYQLNFAVKQFSIHLISFLCSRLNTDEKEQNVRSKTTANAFVWVTLWSCLTPNILRRMTDKSLCGLQGFQFVAPKI